jgi:hypothetical protein
MSSSINTPIKRLKTESAQRLIFEIPHSVETTPKLSFSAISDPLKILELREEIDAFVNKWSSNPFLLSGYLSRFMRSNRISGWTPFVLVAKADEKIVALAPLMIKKRLGMGFVRFSQNYWFTPDFVVDKQYREAFIDSVFEYLFRALNCQFASFCLSVLSQNLKTLKQLSKVNGVSFFAKNQPGYCVLPVECSWAEFQERKGRRRIIRQIERKLNQLGPWKIECVEDVYNRPDVLERILDVEKMSWKESWRNGKQMSSDEDLLMIWEGSQIAANTKTGFKGSVWFLQINQETVAYSFVIRSKQTAFIAKTSYNNRFRKFYVGKYLMHSAIGSLFDENKVAAIDFMTDLPFMSFWSPLSFSRVEVDMTKGNLATFVQTLSGNTYVPQVFKDILIKIAQ